MSQPTMPFHSEHWQALVALPARAAWAFTDYLTAQGLQVKCQPDAEHSEQQFVRWCNGLGITNPPPFEPQQQWLFVQEAQVILAQAHLRAFMAEPNHPKFWQASWQTGEVKAPSANQQTSSLGLISIWHSAPNLVRYSSLLMLALFAVSSLGGLALLFYYLGFNPANPITWLTPALMHLSLFHFIFNLVWWWSIGGQIEQRLGASRLLMVALSSAVASSWLQFVMVDAQFAGLSGVVYGILAFCWLYGKLQPQSGLFLSNAMAGFMLLWLVLGFSNLLPIGIANYAHLGGLLCGLAMAALMKPRSG